MQELDIEALLWSIAILALPLLMAIPARLVWHMYVGKTLDQQEYRAHVRAILDSGQSLERHREKLDDEARQRNITIERVRLIETDVLFPLGLHHFILLPALIILPVAVLLASPLFLLVLPLMAFTEWVLIDRKLLVSSLKYLQDWTKWGIIHIPQVHRDHDKLRQDLVSFHRMPRSVFLGLFAWLIVHWSFRTDFWVEFLISGVIYLAMLSVLEVISNAIAAELVFADASRTSLMQVEAWAESYINPLVGVGLLFLLGRDLMAEARGGNSILFALTVLLVLFSVTVVGMAVEIGYAQRRGKKVRDTFAQQVVEVLDPVSYSFNRHEDRLLLHVECSMRDRLLGKAVIKERDAVTFGMIDNLPSRLDNDDSTMPIRPDLSFLSQEE
ncbi:hypothetical protein OAJ94_00315 [Deltaproteobacteria bacterium]|nr:hypothetical protein [Deltaproteobacteria bacterium]